MQVAVEQLDAAVVRHDTSRAGDPHRQLHLQINARVFAAGAWRGPLSVGVVNSIEAINGIGHAAVVCDPEFHGCSPRITTGTPPAPSTALPSRPRNREGRCANKTALIMASHTTNRPLEGQRRDHRHTGRRYPNARSAPTRRSACGGPFQAVLS